MYYNLKIKSKGSEFCLESKDKEIIEREMDLYFSEIFHVSDEFKSKIKKVIVTDKNVKSICEVESITQNTSSSDDTEECNTLKNSIPEENIKDTVESIDIKGVIEEIEPIAPVVEPQDEIDIEIQKLAKTAPSLKDIIENTQNSIKDGIPQSIQDFKLNMDSVELTPIGHDYKAEVTETPNEFIFQEKNEVMPDEKVEDTFVFKEESNNVQNISEILSAAQKQIEELDINIETPIESTIVNVEKAEVHTGEEINSIFDDDIEAETANESENEQAQDDIKSNFNLTNQDRINSIFDDNIQNNDINNSQAANDNIVDSPIAIQDVQDVQDVPIVNIQESHVIADENQTNVQPLIQPVVEEIPVQSTELEQKNYTEQNDFKSFLQQMKNVNLISDQFLVCAFYLKNMQGQELFTMKNINSKLFQAINTIATTSVADELIAKGYLNVITDSDFKKYSITKSGEEYFLEAYQE